MLLHLASLYASDEQFCLCCAFDSANEICSTVGAVIKASITWRKTAETLILQNAIQSIHNKCNTSVKRMISFLYFL